MVRERIVNSLRTPPGQTKTGYSSFDVYADDEATRHLLTVASGLESAVASVKSPVRCAAPWLLLRRKRKRTACPFPVSWFSYLNTRRIQLVRWVRYGSWCSGPLHCICRPRSCG